MLEAKSPFTPYQVTKRQNLLNSCHEARCIWIGCFPLLWSPGHWPLSELLPFSGSLSVHPCTQHCSYKGKWYSGMLPLIGGAGMSFEWQLYPHTQTVKIWNRSPFIAWKLRSCKFYKHFWNAMIHDNFIFFKNRIGDRINKVKLVTLAAWSFLKENIEFN